MTDYDSPWKDVLERYFAAFTAFFFPTVHEGIDWARGLAHALAAKGAELVAVDSNPVDAVWDERPAPSAALTALHQASQALAEQAGVPPEPRAWTPHVTVLRQADQVAPAPLAAPLPWRVRQVALVWSDLQAQPPRYHRLGEFPAR